MHFAWNWTIFVPALIFFTIMSHFSHGVLDEANIAKFVKGVDYRRDPAGAIMASVMAGAVYAGIATVILGFIS